jgi:hypothetical protein
MCGRYTKINGCLTVVFRWWPPLPLLRDSESARSRDAVSTRCRASELARESTVHEQAEVVLGPFEFVLGSRPLGASGRCARFWAEGVAEIGDGVIEAVALDALGCLLPDA